MPKLPTLIFAENHLDPTTAKVLTQLLPKLKKMGYECFLDETPSDSSIKNQLELIDQNKDLWNQLTIKLEKELGININDQKFLNNAFFATTRGKEIKYFITRHQSLLCFEPFLNALEKYQIRYVGIDVEEKESKREKHMADALSNPKFSAFSRIGRRHVAGIQNEILKVHDLRIASANYCFFDINSERKTVISKTLPLEVLNINISKKTELDIIISIQDYIVRKQQEFDALQDLSQPIVKKVCNYAARLGNGICNLLSSIGLFSRQSQSAESPKSKSNFQKVKIV